jgi:hypothetical protein
MRYDEMLTSLHALRRHALVQYSLLRVPAFIAYVAMLGSVFALQRADEFPGMYVWKGAVLVLGIAAMMSVFAQMMIIAGKRMSAAVSLADAESPIVAMLSLVFAGHAVYLALVNFPGLASLNLLVAALLTWRFARPSTMPRMRV